MLPKLGNTGRLRVDIAAHRFQAIDADQYPTVTRPCGDGIPKASGLYFVALAFGSGIAGLGVSLRSGVQVDVTV